MHSLMVRRLVVLLAEILCQSLTVKQSLFQCLEYFFSHYVVSLELVLKLLGSQKMPLMILLLFPINALSIDKWEAQGIA